VVLHIDGNAVNQDLSNLPNVLLEFGQMFEGFKTSGILLVAVGVAAIAFGLLPSVNFYTEFPTLRGIVRKPLPRWSGRLWFAAAGALLIHWGLTHGRL
jgi:hypothetical protein